VYGVCTKAESTGLSDALYVRHKKKKERAGSVVQW
jgi:hypothetical protein